MMRFREERGFTLIELMVVVLIIAILVAIAIPIFNRARENAWLSTCKANLRTIDGAVQTYAAAGEAYGDDFGADLDGGHPLIPDFLKSAPACPKARALDPTNYDSAPIADGGKASYTISAGAGSTAAALYQSSCLAYGADTHKY